MAKCAASAGLGSLSLRALSVRVNELLGATYADSQNSHGYVSTSYSRNSTALAGNHAQLISLASPDTDCKGEVGGSYTLHFEQQINADRHVNRMLRRIAAGDFKSFVHMVPERDRVRLVRCLAIHSRRACVKDAPRCSICPLVSFCETGRSRTVSDTKSATAVDLFGGAGALGLGFRRAGFSVVAAVEIDRNAAQTYRLNHPGVPVLEASVEKVTAENLRLWLPNLTAPTTIIAGPPCQGYSAAGSRNLDDRRNLLFRHVGRLAKQLRARSIVIENVPGVRRVNGVIYTDKITASMRRCGYRTWKQPIALRASDFGVPQNRRRLFFIGVKHDITLPKPPLPTHMPTDGPASDPLRPRTPSLAERLKDLPPLLAGTGAERLEIPDGRIVLNSKAMSHSPKVIAKIRGIPAGAGPISYRRLGSDVARTLVAGHRALPVHPYQDRTITVREAARIQGFPDDYFFCGPRSTQPLQVANAVPPALSEAVARQLLKSLDAA